MIDLNKLTNTEYATGKSPFLRGGSAVFLNLSAGPLVVQSAQTAGGAYTTYLTVPAATALEGNDLPPFLKVSTAAEVLMLA